MIWERKILRKIYGPTYGNGYCRLKINKKNYNKFKSPDIISIIKVHAQGIPIEWLWYAVRMDGTRTVKQLL
jgi:hypothetical protein